MDLYEQAGQGLYNKSQQPQQRQRPSRRQLRMANIVGALADGTAIEHGNPMQGLAFSMPQSLLDKHQSEIDAQQERRRQMELDNLNRRNINSQIDLRSAQANTGADRKMFKGADGKQYWQDTQQQVLPDLGVPPDKELMFKQEQKLRSEFQALNKDFRGQELAFGRIQASAINPSAAGDLALIFNYMKILDPGSVVRESEFATAAASGSFGERIQAAVQKIVRGERLSPEMRADFVGRAVGLYEEASRGFARRRDQYQVLANSYNLSPDNIVSSDILYQPDSYASLIGKDIDKRSAYDGYSE